MKNPPDKALPCSHELCNDCIHQMESSDDVTCPQCRTPWAEIHLGKHSPTFSKKSDVECVCPKHQERLTMWCKSCSKIVCVNCIAVEHGGHHFEMLNKAGKDIESYLRKKIGDLETNCEQDSVKLLQKYSEVEESILSQIIDQQKKHNERKDNTGLRF